MENRTLELEIEYSWWIRRGHQQDYYDGYDMKTNWIRPTDPMERSDYNEACAFPMQKPNFNIFGIQKRTRSQRGWYQVQHHPNACHKHICVLYTHSSSSSSDAPATGADLAIELVRLVGKLMSQRLEWRKVDDRRTMTTCALVCRYWASQFLRRIYSSISVDSRQHALGLLEFDFSPACWFRRVVKPEVLVNIKNLAELSFTHLLTCHERKSLNLIGPLPRSWRTMRSIHQMLPQSLPCSFSSGIMRISLTGIHFQRFYDLVHLVCELPDLKDLTCTKVTSGPLPDMITALPRRRQTTKHRLQLVIYSEDMSVQARVHLLTHYLFRHGYPFFPPTVIPTPTSILDHIFHMSLTADAPNSKRYSGGKVMYTLEDPWFSLQWSYTGPITLAVLIQATLCSGPDGQAAVLDVTDVTVYLGHLCELHSVQWIQAFDWRKFDSHISSLNPTRLIVALHSREHILTFGEQVADALMPCVSACGLIMYALRVKGVYGDRWYKASRDSDALRGRPKRDLQDLYKD